MDVYSILVSVISDEVVLKKRIKQVKKKEVRPFIEANGIHSYVEISFEHENNLELLDNHVKFVMNPFLSKGDFSF